MWRRITGKDYGDTPFRKCKVAAFAEAISLLCDILGHVDGVDRKCQQALTSGIIRGIYNVSNQLYL